VNRRGGSLSFLLEGRHSTNYNEERGGAETQQLFLGAGEKKDLISRSGEAGEEEKENVIFVRK